MYIFKRCYVTNFINNFKLIYKFIDANQKIFKRERVVKVTLYLLGSH